MEGRIKEIIDRCKILDSEQAAIERQCELEHGGKFTAELREKWDALDNEYKALKAEKDEIEADMERKAARRGRADDMQPKTFERKSPANSGAPAPTPIETGADDDPAPISFKIPAKCLRFGKVENFQDDPGGYSAKQKAYRFGQWALAKLSHDVPGSYRFNEAINFVNNYMGGIQNTAHGEDPTTGGHFLVPNEFSADLINLKETYGVARQVFQRVPMMSDVKHVPKRATGLTAYFLNESDQITESNMTFSDIMLVAKKVGAISRISNELNADAVISIGDLLAYEIAYAFANKEDDCAFNGDGTSTYGGIRGVRQLLTSIDDAGTDSAGLATAASSGSWANIVLADFEKVVSLLPQFADTNNCTWLMHRTFYYQVALKAALAAGGNTENEIANGERRPRPLFLGYPVTFSQIFPSSTAASQVCCALGDFKMGALFGDRAETTIAFSEHAYVNSQSVFERDQIAVRGTERFDIVIHGCGSSSAVGPIVGLTT